MEGGSEPYSRLTPWVKSISYRATTKAAGPEASFAGSKLSAGGHRLEVSAAGGLEP